MENTLTERVGDTTISLTVRVEPKDHKWNGYDLVVTTDEGYELAIKQCSIWGLRAFVLATKDMHPDSGVYDQIRLMVDCYPH